MKKFCSSVLWFYVFLTAYSVIVWIYIAVRLLTGYRLGVCIAIAIIWLITCTVFYLLWSLYTLHRLNKELDEEKQEAGRHGKET